MGATNIRISVIKVTQFDKYEFIGGRDLKMRKIAGSLQEKPPHRSFSPCLVFVSS